MRVDRGEAGGNVDLAARARRQRHRRLDVDAVAPAGQPHAAHRHHLAPRVPRQPGDERVGRRGLPQEGHGRPGPELLVHEHADRASLHQLGREPRRRTAPGAHHEPVQPLALGKQPPRDMPVVGRTEQRRHGVVERPTHGGQELEAARVRGEEQGGRSGVPPRGEVERVAHLHPSRGPGGVVVEQAGGVGGLNDEPGLMAPHLRPDPLALARRNVGEGQREIVHHDAVARRARAQPHARRVGDGEGALDGQGADQRRQPEQGARQRPVPGLAREAPQRATPRHAAGPADRRARPAARTRARGHHDGRP